MKPNQKPGDLERKLRALLHQADLLSNNEDKSEKLLVDGQKNDVLEDDDCSKSHIYDAINRACNECDEIITLGNKNIQRRNLFVEKHGFRSRA